MPESNRQALMIMGPLFLLIGLGILCYTAKRIWFFWRSRHWPCATAVITQSEVRDEQDDDGNNYASPYVEYSFEVQGRKFTASTRLFGFATERSKTSREARLGIINFQIGSHVPVWYHPRKPNLCVLERRIENGIYLFFLFGAALIFFATRMLLETIRGY
jgi:hypothetical protein